MSRIPAYTDDRNAELFKLAVLCRERASLSRAARRAVLRVEIENDAFSGKNRQADGIPVLVKRVKFGAAAPTVNSD